jgi:hypothetical protein
MRPFVARFRYTISASRSRGTSTARGAVISDTGALSGIWHRLRAIRHCGLAQAVSPRTVSRSKSLPREHQTALVNHHHAHALAALFYTDWTIYSAEGIGDHVSDRMRSFIEHSNAGANGSRPDGRRAIAGPGPDGCATQAAGLRKRRPGGKLDSAAGTGTATLTDQFARHFRLNERSAVRRLLQERR